MRAGLLPRLVLLAVLLPSAAGAVQPDEVLPDRALEARARTISEQLRCLVCQNQSIDDSDAPLARDLRLLVRERLRLGDSNDAVERYVVRRYGEFVLLRPVIALHTALLWFGPPAILLCGALGLFLSRRRGRPNAARPLDGAEEAKLQAIVEGRDV